ncbi:hypothetical protein TWF694_006519 [Orbilia ellipsospora]|uniref:Uncharacterized protein n=1 Tax=Orbilia ellipsospora TaxID=2528407 RepID=A0AAV9XLZ8_9PEZI
MALPRASVFPQNKCDHASPIPKSEEADVFEVVSMHDWADRFTVIPIAETLEKWERSRIPMSIPRTHTNSIIGKLVINSTYYSWEHAIYTKIIISMLETFDLHAVKMLRRKRIRGLYYYSICEMLKEPDDLTAVATFMATVSAGKKPKDMDLQGQDKSMKPTRLSCWTLFYELLSCSDEELEKRLCIWEDVAKKWALVMVQLLCVQKKLQKEGILCDTEEVFECLEDKEVVWGFISECLRAGSDRYALSNTELAEMRVEVMRIVRDMFMRTAVDDELSCFDIDMLKFYIVILVQICSTGDLVAALLTWKEQREGGIQRLREMALDRMYRDLEMQEVVGFSSSESDGSDSDSKSSTF